MSCKQFRTYFVLLILIYSNTSTAQQQKWPKTLLWRISGKGLKYPSYLFGTMHLQDKRLFYFGDSLYHAIENTDGMALEIDFDEMMDSVVTNSFKDAEKGLLTKLIIDRKKYGKEADTILRKFGIKGDRVTSKQLKEIRNYRIRQLSEGDEMPTFVDAYLFSIAKRQNKWLGGIEDVKDQLDLDNEMGNDLKPEEVFQPLHQMKQSLDLMKRFYLDQDLEAIAAMCYNTKDQEMTDKMLINRNIKMARRMDSLSAIRSMFFAVGCAHLPGDSGVISFLRKRGFTVEPVFAKDRVFAGTYSGKLKSIEWQKVKDANNLYTIEMPGNAFEQKMLGEIVKMKMCFDWTTMTYYMTGNSLSGISEAKQLHQMMSTMAGNFGKGAYKISDVKQTAKDGFLIEEATIDCVNGVYHVQLRAKSGVLYMLIAGSDKASNLVSSDLIHFFNSFAPLTVEVKDWVKFDMPEKGFSVLMPGAPKENPALVNNSNWAGWHNVIYDYMDLANQQYYLLQVRDLEGGYTRNNDSLLISFLSDLVRKNADKVYINERFTFKGLPAWHFEGATTKQNSKYKIISILRGNRIYTISSITTIDKDFTTADRFFDSFTFTKYKDAAWQIRYSGAGFYAPSPSAFLEFKVKSNDSTNETNAPHYFAYDPFSGTSYDLIKSTFPKYYWVKNDSLYFEEKIKSYKDNGNSLSSIKHTQNGTLQGLEFTIDIPGTQNQRRVRMILGGDTLYVLSVEKPSSEINDESCQQFFTGFRMVNEIRPTIFTKKTTQYLNDLKTKDSAAFEHLANNFPAFEMSKEDLPFLHKAMLENYYDSSTNSYDGMNAQICEQVAKLSDTSTIRFIQDNYKLLGPEKENIKYRLLKVLSANKTSESYKLLKQLLLTDLPKGEDPGIAHALTDSMQLTKTFYPEILALHKDSTFCDALVSITKDLLDSNLLDIKDIRPYEDAFLGHAMHIFKNKAEVTENWWLYQDWVRFISKFNDQKSNALLEQLLKINADRFKYTVIIALLDNKQHVDPVEINKVAADREYRANFYDDLVAIGYKSLFPAAYATQKAIAESEMYLIATDDQDISAMSFVGERVMNYMGSKKKFYLFKVSYPNEDNNRSESYLGITGPYDLTTKELITSSELGGFYSKGMFSALKVDQHLKEYLAEQEQASKKSAATQSSN